MLIDLSKKQIEDILECLQDCCDEFCCLCDSNYKSDSCIRVKTIKEFKIYLQQIKECEIRNRAFGKR